MKQNDWRKVKILCVCILPLLLLAPSPQFRVIHATCERVLDGDTVEVLYGQQRLKLRLAYIDAPELKQKAFDKTPIGKDSRDLLSALVKGKRIEVHVIQKDRYGRYLARIESQGIDVNLKMVEAGQALIYRYYEFDSIKQKINYLTAELVAKRKRRGVWKTFGFYDPYAYRRIKRKKK